MNRQQANALMSMQSLAARQAWRSLVAVARDRLKDLEYAQSVVSDKAQADALRLKIAKTRSAIHCAELLGDA